MHVVDTTAGLAKRAAYRELQEQLAALYLGERDGLANAANMCAVLYRTLPDVNWAGFYFARGNELVLGPFQGNVACVRIPLGRGVCGTAAERRGTLVVPDVHAFPGHIACDAASRSEIVVPLLQNDRLWGVLDLDSPLPARFDDDDAIGLEALLDIFLQGSDLNRLLPSQ
jgi:GAF domain-containing protein